ncbi:MAG TPA: glycosyltransferase [Candidatus Dormibacteraeota bacterium]|nr:glycosyltransferase [Candidatus Dormibacteraeota bacterium]
MFVSVPGLGHINPMLPLATALREDLGHEVHWAVHEEFRAHLEERGFVVHPCGINSERWARLAAITGAERPVGPATPAFFSALFGRVLAPPMLADLARVVHDWTPDVFVHDRNEFATALVAASVGRRHVTSNFGAMPPEANISEAATAVAPLWESLGLAMPVSAGTYQHAFIDIYPEALQARQELPCPRLPLRPAERSVVAPPEWWSTLDDRPTIYVTFGTIFNEPGVIQLALDAVAVLDVNVVATTGRDVGDAIRPGRNTRVLAYLSQETVLPLVSAVLSHAGSGTFLGALAHGLPQVCVPRGADQFLNARLGTEAGVATTVVPEDYSVESVREAVTRVLTDEAIRRRAEQLAIEIASMPDARTVAEQVAALGSPVPGASDS